MEQKAPRIHGNNPFRHIVEHGIQFRALGIHSGNGFFQFAGKIIKHTAQPADFIVALDVDFLIKVALRHFSRLPRHIPNGKGDGTGEDIGEDGGNGEGHDCSVGHNNAGIADHIVNRGKIGDHVK